MDATRIQRIASRVTAGSASSLLQDALKTLKVLDILSDNIEDAVETFSLHFRVASAVKTDVDSQFDLLKKADEGLRAAQGVKKSVQEVLRQFPDDKTALRAMSDADVMIKRFWRHGQQARKVIQTLSSKQIPPALKKYADSVVRILRAKFSNPKDLVIIPWQRSFYGGGVRYQVILRVEVGKDVSFNGVEQLILAEDTNSRDMPGVDTGTVDSMPPKQAAEGFLDRLRAWPGLKGGEDTLNARRQVAEGVANAMRSALNRMSGYDSTGPEIENGHTLIRGEYRSNLPKGGASDVGHNRYREMVEKEITAFKAVLEPMLARFKSEIKSIRYGDEEKSRISVEVELK